MTGMLLTLPVALAALTLLWLLSLILKDVSIVDIFWGPGFVLIAAATAWRAPPPDARSLLLLALVSLWAFRLAAHLFVRWRHLGHEDRRYMAMRKRSGAVFPVQSLFTVFWLQGVIMWIVSLPVQAALMAAPSPLGPLDYAGGAIAVAGLIVETIADMQLTRFVRDPANQGHVMDKGTWSWSRHPNYFGDTTVWWGLFLVSVAGSGAWWTAISPALMTFILLRVSGVTLLERNIANRRPGYAEYVRRTSAFVPLPPKRS
jgi:steroid 5-alpha reductase family enzyme